MNRIVAASTKILLTAECIFLSFYIPSCVISMFFLTGTVVRSINPKCAIVDFFQGENMIVPIRFIIQTGGALPWPILKVILFYNFYLLNQ